VRTPISVAEMRCGVCQVPKVVHIKEQVLVENQVVQEVISTLHLRAVLSVSVACHHDPSCSLLIHVLRHTNAWCLSLYPVAMLCVDRALWETIAKEVFRRSNRLDFTAPRVVIGKRVPPGACDDKHRANTQCGSGQGDSS
jgi:hypothetical protein